ncbi:MAG: 5'-3' exonuclease H3TH domain-containing protein [Planctomycetota bacterium]
MSRLHLIDGTFELFRAHYSRRPPHAIEDGRDVKATVGVVSSMLALLADAEERPTHLAIAFDNPIRSFRNRLFAGYKTEAGVPAELLAQFDLVEDAARALGLLVWSMDEWEADDALATAAARWGRDFEQVRILTPDKDLGQCLVGDHVVQVDRIRRKVIDEPALVLRRGVRPRSIPDLLALTGDDADGIPGLSGFGEATAAALLSQYPHLEDIPRDPSQWSRRIRFRPVLAATLFARFADALLYRQLATLVEDVPLAASLDDLQWRGAPRGEFLEWCDRMRVHELREQPSRWR